MPGRVVVQWDKDDCADLGIIKVDLLGLGMMAVLEDASSWSAQHWRRGARSRRTCRADDPAVYEPAQGRHHRRVPGGEPRADGDPAAHASRRSFYDLVVEVAHHPARADRRPDGASVSEPARTAASRSTTLHPLLEPILERTLGVPLFQEQLLRMAMVAAGFTGGEAEELRRAMGFKRSRQRMQEIESAAARRHGARGITGDAQDAIVQAITSFALYGFPESHAASFALLAYASAYLKCHYLAAFTCALLNNQPMGFYHPAVLVKDAQRHGLRVLPVDVNISEWDCTIEGPTPRCASASATSAAFAPKPGDAWPKENHSAMWTTWRSACRRSAT